MVSIIKLNTLNLTLIKFIYFVIIKKSATDFKIRGNNQTRLCVEIILTIEKIMAKFDTIKNGKIIFTSFGVGNLKYNKPFEAYLSLCI